MEQSRIHEEISWLQKELESRKEELSKSGEKKEDREILKDVLKETPNLGAPSLPQSQAQNDDDSVGTYQVREKEHSKIIDELLKVAFEKSIFQALSAARALKNPHLLDEFHDTLADNYYEKLNLGKNS